MNKRATRILACMISILGWSYPAFTEQPPVPRGEVRIVDTRFSNRWSIMENVYEGLLRFATDGTPVTQLATTWR